MVTGPAMGTARTTTTGGQTIVVSKPSATNTIVMVNDRSEIPSYTYDAQFLQSSLSSKYGVSSPSGPTTSGGMAADQRTTACNQEAGSMKGDARKQFMMTCLAAKR